MAEVAGNHILKKSGSQLKVNCSVFISYVMMVNIARGR